MKSIPLSVYILLLCLSYSPDLLFGQSKVWDGGAGTNHWHDSDNWDPNGVPTSLSDVSIPTSPDSVFVNGDATCNSILLIGDLVVPPNVELRITGSSIDRTIDLVRQCTLENEGTIIIDGAQVSRIHIDQCELINKNSGVIEILSSSNDGITLVEGKLINRDDATIMILDVVDNALLNQDTVINRGMMKIDNCNDGIWNEGVFRNTATAHLSIRRSSDAIENYKSFSNAGNIVITKFNENGIYNDDDDNSVAVLFINQGDIVIDSIGDDGIFNRGYLLNDTIGQITIQNTIDGSSGNGIINSDTLDNHGTLIIRDISAIGIHSSNVLFYNTGLTRMVRCGMLGLLIDDQSFFRNEEDSELTIVDCNTPIEVESGSLFNCRGILTIEP